MTRAKAKKLILTGQEDTDSYERLLAQKDEYDCLTLTPQSVTFPGLPEPPPTRLSLYAKSADGFSLMPVTYTAENSDMVAALANQSFWETVHKCYPQVKLSGEVLSLTGPSAKKFDAMCRKMVKEWVENNNI